MSVTTALRQAQREAIQENPVEITIQRTTKAADATGGLSDTVSIVGPFKVRIVMQRSVDSNIVSGTAGTKVTNPNWGLIADHEIDLQAGADVKDEFDVADLGHFIITAVRPWKVLGDTIGYQADLEKVS